MMLSVFIVHGVDPGPALFQENPQFVSGLYVSLFLMNFVIVGILLLTTNWIAKLATIDDRVLGVAVMILGLIGSYSSSYRLSDTFIAIFFGLVGYVLKRQNIPVIPIVLGLILGSIVERYLRQGIGAEAGDLSILLMRPVSLVVMLIIVWIAFSKITGFSLGTLFSKTRKN